MNTRSMIEAHNVIHAIHTNGELVLRGMMALATLREAIQLCWQSSGIRPEFDPTSDPTLVDYLAVTGERALQGGLMGGALGLLVGALVNRPLEGAALGAGIGVTIGVAQGLDRVARGWRVSAYWLPDGTPSMVVHEV